MMTASIKAFHFSEKERERERKRERERERVKNVRLTLSEILCFKVISFSFKSLFTFYLLVPVAVAGLKPLTSGW
jgi:hypothetical protein